MPATAIIWRHARPSRAAQGVVMRIAVTVVALSLLATPAFAEGPAPSAASCGQLARTLSLKNATVTAATVVPAGTFVPPGGGAAAKAAS